jgi:hypothetical protein
MPRHRMSVFITGADAGVDKTHLAMRLELKLCKKS